MLDRDPSRPLATAIPTSSQSTVLATLVEVMAALVVVAIVLPRTYSRCHSNWMGSVILIATPNG